MLPHKVMVTRLKYIQSVMFSTFGKLFQDATAEDSDLQHFTGLFSTATREKV